MIYTFNADFGGQDSSGYFLSWVRNGDDGKTEKGKVPASEKLEIKTSLDKPGFVSIDVFIVDAKGKKQVFYQKLKNNRKRKQFVAFYSGTAVAPETLTDCGEPADFDAFWQKQKKRLAEVPFKDSVKITKVKSTDAGDVYAVYIPCAGPRPATGYLTIPANAKQKSLPAEIKFFGYGHRIQPIPPVNPKMISLGLNAHGQELGKDAAHYKEFFRSLRSNGHNYAFDPEQNKNPETAFFNGMALRIIRALEYLKSRPEWDGKNLRASGSSQGGMQTLWAAALDSDVTEAFADIPWSCDMAGTAKKQRYCGNRKMIYVPGLDYYDPVFMVKRIKKAKVKITRGGLGDYTCPPSGVAICYKNIASPHKSIKWVQGSNHSFIPKKSEVILWQNSK